VPAPAPPPAPAAPPAPAPQPPATRIDLDKEDGDRLDRVLLIAEEFEKQGLPAILGVTTAMIESTIELNPNLRNRIGYMGLFQTQVPGRADNGPYVADVNAAKAGPPEAITKSYSVAEQVKDAARWSSDPRYRPAGADVNTRDEGVLLQWAMLAQGVNLSNNPHYDDLWRERRPAAEEALRQARERGPR
jgi:hypothetical protein